jgi:hypothetical protein
MPLISALVNRLNIPGHRDVAVKQYNTWQQSKFNNKALKVEVQKACEVALKDSLDLEQIYEDQDSDFFVKNGVKEALPVNSYVISNKGIARLRAGGPSTVY